MARIERRSTTTSARRGSALSTASAIGIATAVGLATAVAPAAAVNPGAAAVGGEDQMRPIHRSPGVQPGRHVPTFRVVAEAPASTYMVRAGDTVSHIAVRTGRTVAAIVTANRLNSAAAIRIGQVLTIPGSGAVTAPTAPAAPSLSGGTYTVASGDSVWVLAQRYKTTVSAVIAANGLNARALIRIGQVLTIPGASAAAPAAVPAP
ncbi:MAG: LysM peptidoglycan-binding domain-containing protein, partial [Actinomycetales bacterium]|nr:LysM peptidoglycan-binding domain-containing protein [Actinomycetales bacterium]